MACKFHVSLSTGIFSLVCFCIVPNHIQKMVLNILLKSHSKYKQAYPLSYQLLLRERRGGGKFCILFFEKIM